MVFLLFGTNGFFAGLFLVSEEIVLVLAEAMELWMDMVTEDSMVERVEAFFCF